MFKEKILNAIKDNRVQRIVLVIIILLICYFSYKSMQSYKSQIAYNRQNQNALLTELRIWKGKAGTTYSSNYSLLGSKNDSLERYSKSLYDALQRLKKEKKAGIKEPMSGASAEFEIGGFSGEKTNTILVYDSLNSEGKFSWKYIIEEKSFSRLLSGSTGFKIERNGKYLTIVPDSTTIEADITKATINLFQIVNKDNSISVIAESESPHLKINDVRSVVYPKTIKDYVNNIETPTDYSVSLGLSGGFGVNPFNLTSGVVVQPYIGIGINFNFIHLFNF